MFNITKLQDNIGAKFFKELLLEFREIDSFAVPMIDILTKLEQLEIIDNIEEWDTLREIRNSLTHDYAMDYDSRLENLERAIWAFLELQKIFAQIEENILKKMQQ